jgi:hypothetical protein
MIHSSSNPSSNQLVDGNVIGADAVDFRDLATPIQQTVRIAISALMAFIQANWTGPDVECMEVHCVELLYINSLIRVFITLYQYVN